MKEKSEYELKISEEAETVKKFSVKDRSKRYFSISYVLLLAISTWLCLDRVLKDHSEPKIFLIFSWQAVWYLSIFVSLQLGYFMLKGSTLVKESLIVVKNIGIQIEKKSLNGKKTKQFLDISRMRDLVINEGLTPYDVRYYMVIISQDAEKLLRPFESFSLKLDTLLQIFYPARRVLQLEPEKQNF